MAAENRKLSLLTSGLSSTRILTPFYAVFAIAEITGSVLRAEGHVLATTVSNLLGICVFRIIWVSFVYPQGTFRQVLTCYPISWVLITLFIGGYYLRTQNKILAPLRSDSNG